MRVTLNGIVAADDDVEIYQWFGYSAFSPKAVRDAVAATPEGEDLVLEINSGGGSVFAGSEIYSVLRASSVHTVAEVQSLAASAASYLCLGCDEVQISPVAQMMIHLPATYTEGNRTAHLQALGCAGMPDITELRARYQAERHPAPEPTPAPTASTGGEPDAHIQTWQAQARLELEKIRF